MELQGRFEDVDAELWPANPTSPGTRGSNRHRSTKRRYKAQSNVLPKNDPETRRAKVELKAKVKKIGELPQGFKLACPFWKGSPEDYPKCWAIHRKDMSGLREHFGRSHRETSKSEIRAAKEWSDLFIICFPNWSHAIPSPYYRVHDGLDIPTEQISDPQCQALILPVAQNVTAPLRAGNSNLQYGSGNFSNSEPPLLDSIHRLSKTDDSKGIIASSEPFSGRRITTGSHRLDPEAYCRDVLFPHLSEVVHDLTSSKDVLKYLKMLDTLPLIFAGLGHSHPTDSLLRGARELTERSKEFLLDSLASLSFELSPRLGPRKANTPSPRSVQIDTDNRASRLVTELHPIYDVSTAQVGRSRDVIPPQSPLNFEVATDQIIYGPSHPTNSVYKISITRYVTIGPTFPHAQLRYDTIIKCLEFVDTADLLENFESRLLANFGFSSQAILSGSLNWAACGINLLDCDTGMVIAGVPSLQALVNYIEFENKSLGRTSWSLNWLA